MKKYRVSESELFNLQSMYEHLKCLETEMIMGETEFDENEWDSLCKKLDETEMLMEKAYCVGAPVDWPTLKRIREIRDERQMIRYATCLSQGTPEKDAALAFSL